MDSTLPLPYVRLLARARRRITADAVALASLAAAPIAVGATIVFALLC